MSEFDSSGGEAGNQRMVREDLVEGGLPVFESPPANWVTHGDEGYALGETAINIKYLSADVVSAVDRVVGSGNWGLVPYFEASSRGSEFGQDIMLIYHVRATDDLMALVDATRDNDGQASREQEYYQTVRHYKDVGGVGFRLYYGGRHEDAGSD